MIYEIRGIAAMGADKETNAEIIIRDGHGENYQTLEYPQGRPINRNNVIIFLCNMLNVRPENIVIPRHIRLE